MRITYVVHQFLPHYFTGTEQYVCAVAHEMHRRGHDVEVFCLEPAFGESDRLFEQSRETVDELPIVRVRFWMHLHRDWTRMEYRHPYVAQRFAEHLIERAPDLVHFFHLRYLGVDLMSVCRARSVPTVVHLMDFWFLCPRIILVRGDGQLCEGPPEAGLGCIDCVEPELGRELATLELRDELAHFVAHRPLPSHPGTSLASRAAAFLERPRDLRRALTTAARIIAPSRFLASVFARNGIETERIDVIPYGVDPDRLRGAGTRPAGGGLRAGFIGTIAPHKGTDIAVDAVLRTTGDLELHGVTKSVTATGAVIGAGDTFFGDYRTGFEASFELDMNDFDIGFVKERPGAVGPLVEITISLECIRQ